MRRNTLLLLLAMLLFFTGCSFYGTQRGPSKWNIIRKPTYVMPPYSKWLAGIHFCLDPGHGGQANLKGYKRGPTGVREAEMNLRVAKYLKTFLESAGARVTLTRTGDYFVSLAKRAEIANKSGADVFISIHHNATGNPDVNYSSVWYHGDVDNSPVSLDVARYLSDALIEYVRLPQVMTSPLISDYNMYPSGFGVLRRLKIPGVLIEASFFSNRKEEKLLSKPKYNKLFAYAYAVALAKWAHAGFPQTQLNSPDPNSKIINKQPTIRMSYTDGIHDRHAWILKRQQVFTESVNFYLDGKREDIHLQRDSSDLTYTPDTTLSNGQHRVNLSVRNMYGNHNLPQNWFFTIAPPAETLNVKPWATSLPPDSRSYVRLAVEAWDADSEHIADGDSISLQTNYGIPEEYVVPANGGTGIFYLHADSIPGVANISISAGNATQKLAIGFNDASKSVIEGQVISETNQPLTGVLCDLGQFDTTSTDQNGHYFFQDMLRGVYDLTFSRVGYYDAYTHPDARKGRTSISNTTLEPVALGALHNQLVVIDPRFGGSEVGTMINDSVSAAQENLAVSKKLAILLKDAGARVKLLRTADVYMSVDARIDSTNKLEGPGTYFRIDMGKWQENQPVVEGIYYPGSQDGMAIVRDAGKQLASLAGDTLVSDHPSSDPEIHDTKFSAAGIELNFIGNPTVQSRLLEDWFQWKIAYMLYQAFVNTNLEQHKFFKPATITVVNEYSVEPKVDFPLTLQGALQLRTDGDGQVQITHLKNHPYRVTYSTTEGPQWIEVEPGGEYTIKITE